MVRSFDRAVLALNRRLTRGRRTRALPPSPTTAALPEERRSGGLRRRSAGVVAALVLTGGAATGGYWVAEVRQTDEPAAAQIGEPLPAVCEARADAARAELDDRRVGELGSMMVGLAAADECRAELELEGARLRSEAVSDQVD